MKDKYIVEFNEKEIKYLNYTMSKHLLEMEMHKHWGKKDLTLLKNLASKISKQRFKGRG
jgi:hypothetical protein